MHFRLSKYVLQEMAELVDTVTDEVRIALVGKYTGLTDSYLSVIKALKHAAIAARRKLVVEWVDAEALEPVSRVRPQERTNSHTFM